MAFEFISSAIDQAVVARYCAKAYGKIVTAY